MIQDSITSRRPTIAIAVALAIGVLLWPLGAGMMAAAAQATPEAAATPDDGISCPVEPTTASRFIAALDAATAEPLVTLTADTLPVGDPADQVTGAEITTTVQTVLSCRNAGDFSRIYALFSDRMIGQLYGGRGTIPPETVQTLQQAPQPVAPPFRVNLVELSAPGLFPDGRAGAVVVTANATHTFTDYLYFVNEDGRWLIDEAIAVVASPAMATPVP